MSVSGKRSPTGRGDRIFSAALLAVVSCYAALVTALMIANATFTTPAAIWRALTMPEIQAALRLSLITSTVSAALAVLVGTPIGYAFARLPFRGRSFIEALLDIPILLPPLVIGLSLLILFRTPPGRWVESNFEQKFGIGITYETPAIVLAQFVVVSVFAIRTMRVAFDQLDESGERIALTLGASRWQAFHRVALPQTRRAVVNAATLAWARAFGEFGPILIFAGATRMKTEVLPTTIYLELEVGRIDAAVAVSLLMVGVAIAILTLTRWLGLRQEPG